MANNPKIHETGDIYFASSHYCEVKTKNGQQSIFKIKNTGENTLTVIVTGAPEEFADFNGEHEILPNNPTNNIGKTADFKGMTVRITNISSLDTECNVIVN